MDSQTLVQEMEAGQPPKQAIAKIRYSHEDMIDFIIANPNTSQGALAARYGYTQSWVSLVMSSDAWKSAMAKRREELVDPTLTLTLNERFGALTELSLRRLTEKLEAPQVADQTVLRAVELGARALGIGGNAPPAQPPAGPDHLAMLAQRLVALQDNVRKGVTYEGSTVEVLPQGG